jgi:hypothetical protein
VVEVTAGNVTNEHDALIRLERKNDTPGPDAASVKTLVIST